ncbi:MAG: IS4 family transposase [Lentisphaeria bacterium]|nr:IS4 family transposase [Lentisphaeria bacterium]
MKSIASLPKTTFSGRRFTRKQLAGVQETVEIFSNLSRSELALTVCEHLDWRTPRGSLKIQSSLTLLEALEEYGVITLPPKRARKPQVRRVPSFEEHPASPPVEGPLDLVTPITLRMVTTQEDRERWKAYLQTYHYLGYKHPFGAHLGYLIVSEPLQQELGCFVFAASAAWALAPRDQWIGWDKKHREKLLQLILSNDRFLIFPWVKVPHLASHALSLATNRIADDWVHLHGYRPSLIETFVDPTRFSGTCYQAANWQCLGQTQGRGRDDPQKEYPETKKDIYVYPLQTNWRESLTKGHRKVELKKRYRNDLASSHKRDVGDRFIVLWENVVEILHQVAAEYDEKWQVRKRVIDSMILMLLIFRLVSSKNSQGYGTTIDDLWDSCDRLKISLPQKSAIAPSSFCAARKKLDESIFQCANRRILEAYAPERNRYTWNGHRLFGIDGSKINLPRSLVKLGYRTPNAKAHYPQGLLSCLYEIQSRLPYDFDLVAHSDERMCARKHLNVLEKNDVVVYDRGYYSYIMLHQHYQAGIHAVFRLQENSSTVIQDFFASSDTDRDVTISPSPRSASDILKRNPDLDIVPLRMRLLKYRVSETTYCLGTTLIDPEHRYSLQEFMDVYHSRWGVEELYKTSKQIIEIEDFHSKTERGVKQEIFAQFVLITMNRLFTNRADIELNADDPFGHSDGCPDQQPVSNETKTRRQTNFKNCIHVLSRSLEELLLLEKGMRSIVQRAFDVIAGQYQRVRPNRSYPRQSLQPDSRWRSSNVKRCRRRLHSNQPA